MSTELRSGQVSAAAGVNVQTLRYYERRGLLEEPARTPGGHRLYPAESVDVLRVIKAAQRLGFTLDEVADLVEAGTATAAKLAGCRPAPRTSFPRSRRRSPTSPSSARPCTRPWPPAATI